MARNARDVERECGQFLERLERQYERAEDQQRRSKTTSATATARMGEELEGEREAPKARAEVTAVKENAPRPAVIAPAQENAPRTAADAPAQEDMPVEPQEPAEPIAPEPSNAPEETEQRIDAPDEPETSFEDGEYEDEPEDYGGEDYSEAEELEEDDGEEEQGPDFAQVVKENLAKAGGLLSALGARVKSGSRKLASRLRREDSIEAEDFDEYEELPYEPEKGEEMTEAESESEEALSAATVPEHGEAQETDGQAEQPEQATDAAPAKAQEAQTVADVPEHSEAQETSGRAEQPEQATDTAPGDGQEAQAIADVPEPTDAADVPDAPVSAVNTQIETPYEPEEEEEEFEEEAPKADLLGGIKSLFARKPKKAAEDEEEDEYEDDGDESDEEYEDDEEADEEEIEEDDEEYEEDEPSVGFAGRIRSLFRRKRDEEEDEEDEDEYEDDDEADEDDEDDEDDAPADAPVHQNKERTMNMEDNQKSLSELLAEGMSDTPSLSRRERRALSAAGEAEKKNAAKDVADDLEMNLSERAVEEEPTVEFHPVHKSARKTLDELDYEDEDDYDDEDDEEEEEKPRKRKEKAKDKKKDKKKRFDEDDEDDDEDDYDDDEDDDYDDEDDEDEDEDDEDDEDDDEEETSFIKHLLGFFKGLLAVALIVLLAVFVLRLLEASGRVSLDWLRNGVGERLPFVNSVFPKP